MGDGLYFEDYAADWSARFGVGPVTDEAITRFVELHGFDTPTFTDRRYVEASKDYGARMAPGLHVLCLAEGAVLRSGLTRRRGIFLMTLTPRFLKPVFAGDSIEVLVRLESKRLTSKPDRGVVVTTHEVLNQRGDVVLDYASTRMIRTRSYVDESAAG